MILIVMGVVGSGKTTIGQLLARELGFEFADADAFHSGENIDKISRGIALSDADRQPWLGALRQQILAWADARTNAVLACSSLKNSYREELKAAPCVRFVYLKGNADLIAGRLSARHGHFASESILASQLADLEEPANAVTVDISGSPQEIVTEIRRRL
ncbi:MAG TPA: gluconokinase [Candidatus Sulfotelmatobacter sp.]